MKRIPLIILVLLALWPSQRFLHAQTSRLTDTPLILQDGFGPNGEYLPDDGLEYCVPTSTTMAFYWLYNNGFTNITSGAFSTNGALALDRTLAGLFLTPVGAGTTGENYQAGMRAYMSFRGYSEGTVTPIIKPNINDFTNAVTGFNMGVINISWIATTNWQRTGGHDVTVVGKGINVSNNPVSTNIVIHNPMVDTPMYLPTEVVDAGTGAPPALQGGLIFTPGYLGTTSQWAYIYAVQIINLGSSNQPLSTYSFTNLMEINSNDSNLEILAPLAGTGGINKFGVGNIVFAGTSTNTQSGTYVIQEGSLIGSQTTATPFGTGSIEIAGGILSFSPGGSGANISQSAASGTGNEILFSGGAISLNQSSNSSLTVTLGGHTDGIFANLQRQPGGSLIITASLGSTNLGGSEKLLVNGSGNNLPLLTHGIVPPAIFGQNNDTNLSGDFLTYDNTRGFELATYSTGDINAANNTQVYESSSLQTILTGSTASVYALKLDGSTISSGGGTTVLNVGNGLANHEAGIILNGGTISSSILNFSDSTGTVYVNKANGLISSEVQGTDGLVITGPGILTLTASNTYSGTTYVNGATLVVNNTNGSGTGTGNLLIRDDATLAGSGFIAGNTTIDGTLSPGNSPGILSFGADLTFNEWSEYLWQLTSLTDSPLDAGIAYDKINVFGDLTFSNGALNEYAQLTFDFSSIANPDSGNTFWNHNRSWLIAEANGALNYSGLSIAAPRWNTGSFSLTNTNSNLYLTYKFHAVPEPSQMAQLLLAATLLLLIRFIHRKKTSAVSIPQQGS